MSDAVLRASYSFSPQHNLLADKKLRSLRSEPYVAKVSRLAPFLTSAA